jgi:HEAT repeat protein
MNMASRITRRFTALLLLVCIGLAPTLAQAEEPLIYYTLRRVQMGNATVDILMPNTVNSPGGNARDRMTAAFEQVQALRPAIYGEVSLNISSDFAQSGRVHVQVPSRLRPEEVKVLISEFYYTLSSHGATDIRFSALGNQPVVQSQVPHVAMVAVIDAVKALPPARVTNVLVLVGDGAVSADGFYRRFAERDPALTEGLLSRLNNSDAPTRLAIVQAMPNLAIADLPHVVLPLLQDADATVREAAVFALEAQKNDPRVQSAMEGLVKNDPEGRIKSAAVKMLLGAGRNEFTLYAEFDKLRSSDPTVVRSAVTRLGESGDPTAAVALIDVLNHSAIELREEAFQALVKIGHGPSLEKAMTDSMLSDRIRAKIAKAMTGHSDTGIVVKGLSFLVTSGEPSEAIRAAEGLGQLKNPAGLSALTEVLNSPEEEVRGAAIRSLGNLGLAEALPHLAPLTSPGPRVSKEQAKAATDASVQILATLTADQVIGFANDPSASVRRLALMALPGFAAEGRNRKVVNVLLTKMDDTGDIRRAAAYALSRIEDDRVATALLRYKTVEDSIVRAEVARAMGWSRSAQAGATAIEMMGDTKSEVKLAAAKAIERRKDHGALDTLLQYRNYGKLPVRRAVMQAILSVSQPTDHDRLLKVYSESLYVFDEEVKLIAIAGLREIQNPLAISNLEAVILDPSDKVQEAAVRALGSKKDPNATEAITTSLHGAESKVVQNAALDAIIESGQDFNRPLQEFWSTTTDPELKSRAEQIMKR